ncbi:hypothetical protein [Paenibacillus sp. 7516]|uniref:hypothetical protein n=1 Tax=Paenibacillus sp. 7516 TaxID=2022549 RepID=UPI000BA5768C|nr:hypothetical protein [Paenibacillus sp. 7516]PAF29618.1 hypothetical protein CHI14_19865 [Paenibacillus sp. 7516]
MAGVLEQYNDLETKTKTKDNNGIFMNRFSEALERINNIDWSISGSVDVPSNMALIQEYIRRAALLITSYDLKSPYPFFKASHVIGHDVDLDLTEKCPELAKLTNSFMKGTCEAYLEWVFLIDSGNEIALKFNDLYKPLIRLIERGGTVRRRHGDIIAGGYVFPLANADYMSKQKPINISDEGLAAWVNQ